MTTSNIMHINKRVRIIIALVASGFVSGCLTLTTYGMTLTAKDTLNIAKPVVAPDQEAHIIRIGFPMSDASGKSEVRLMPETEMELFKESFAKTDRFKIIVLSVAKLKDLNVYTDASQMIDEDLGDYAKKVCAAASCDAILHMDARTEEFNMSGEIAKAVFVGKMDFPATHIGKLYSATTGDLVWHQELSVVYNSGSRMLTGYNVAQLKEIFRPGYAPLFKNLIDTAPPVAVVAPVQEPTKTISSKKTKRARGSGLKK